MAQVTSAQISDVQSGSAPLVGLLKALGGRNDAEMSLRRFSFGAVSCPKPPQCSPLTTTPHIDTPRTVGEPGVISCVAFTLLSRSRLCSSHGRRLVSEVAASDYSRQRRRRRLRRREERRQHRRESRDGSKARKEKSGGREEREAGKALIRRARRGRRGAVNFDEQVDVDEERTREQESSSRYWTERRRGGQKQDRCSDWPARGREGRNWVGGTWICK